MHSNSPSRLLGTTQSQTAVSLIDQVIVSATRFVTTVMIGRLASDGELGIYTLAFSVLMLIISLQESLILVPFTVFVGRMPERNQNEYGGSAIAQAAVLNIAATVVLLAGCRALALAKVDWNLVAVLIWLAILSPLLLLREFARRFAFAHLHMKSALLVDIAASLMQLVGLAILASADLLTASWAYVVSGIAAGLAGGFWLHCSRGQIRLTRDRFAEDLRCNWNFGKWVMAAHLTSVLHMYYMHWLLAIVINESATGVFSAAMTVFVLANPFILGLSNVLSPQAAHVAAAGPEAVSKVVWKYTGAMIAGLFVFASLAFWLGGEFVVWVFGPEYAGQDTAIGILSLGTVALGASYTMAAGLRALDRPQSVFWTGILGLAVTISIATPLVNSFSTCGAAFGLVGGIVAIAICRIALFMRS